MPKKTALVVLAAVLAALALVPAAASATVYCVDDSPAELADNLAVDPSCEVAKAAIAEALEAANAAAAADSVLIGPGEFTLPGGANELYYSGSGANTLQLRGSGTAATHLTMGSTAGLSTGLWVGAPAGSSVSDLSLTIPANVDAGGDTGIVLYNGVAGRRLRIDGPSSGNATGLRIAGGAELRESTIELPLEASPSDTAVAAISTPATILDSRLRANDAIATSGNVVTVERSTIEAVTGVHTDGGTFKLRDSLLRLADRFGAVGVALANYNKGALALAAEIEGVTIVGGAAANTAAIRVMANDNQESAKASIVDTLVSGPATALQLWADNGREAMATVAYSNFGAPVDVQQNLDGSGEAGTATYQASDVTNLAPGFADPAAGDFHLAAGSPLIDLGSPAAPGAEELDIDGQARGMSAACPLAAGRRDIGADELVPTCGSGEATQGEAPAAGAGDGVAGPAAAPKSPPDTAIAAPRRILTAAGRAKVGFRLSSTEGGARFRCKLDRGPFRPCPTRWSAWLKPGRHRVLAVAVGAAGADPSPAAVTVKVVQMAR